ncbi:hypothetical protein CB1_001033036 [Camelus ferus]|nr:hypothetical protein CB1_001033036 [Camelus ferus]
MRGWSDHGRGKRICIFSFKTVQSVVLDCFGEEEKTSVWLVVAAPAAQLALAGVAQTAHGVRANPTVLMRSARWCAANRTRRRWGRRALFWRPLCRVSHVPARALCTRARTEQSPEDRLDFESLGVCRARRWAELTLLTSPPAELREGEDVKAGCAPHTSTHHVALRKRTEPNNVDEHRGSARCGQNGLAAPAAELPGWGGLLQTPGGSADPVQQPPTLPLPCWVPDYDKTNTVDKIKFD